MSDPQLFRIGLLGHGTVGGAFATLLEERADEIAAVTGLRPDLVGVLTRSRGEFADILERSDLIVEVMGGLEPAREHVLAAMAAGRHVVTANKQLLSQHGEELWSCAREDRHLGRRVLAVDVLGRVGLGLKLIGTAERIDGGVSVRVHPAYLYGDHPLASDSGPYNAETIESQAITEITLSGPGAGGPQTASAVLGDVISAMIPPASTPPTTATLPIVGDVESAFYLYLEVADRPGVLAQVAQLLGLQGASIRSVVQKGLGENARLVMVTHPILESRFYAALELIAGLDFIRARPRAIRVIDEEFV